MRRVYIAGSSGLLALLLGVPSPALAQARLSVRAITASGDYSSALASDGTVWEWGGARYALTGNR